MSQVKGKRGEGVVMREGCIQPIKLEFEREGKCSRGKGCILGHIVLELGAWTCVRAGKGQYGTVRLAWGPLLLFEHVVKPAARKCTTAGSSCPAWWVVCGAPCSSSAPGNFRLALTTAAAAKRRVTGGRTTLVTLPSVFPMAQLRAKASSLAISECAVCAVLCD
jgi:hypothetical protein